MPELPEAETIRLDLEKRIVGLSIHSVKVIDPRNLQNITPLQFIEKLTGQTFQSIFRKGKALILQLNNDSYLIVQLGMTGQLIVGKEFKDAHTKIVIKLSNNQYLIYNDQRIFGKIHLVKNLKQVPFLNQLGPDPIHKTFQLSWLELNVKEKNAPIKTLLMNQHFLAGIGNIYASEILFRAGIRPQKISRRLKKDEIKKLFWSMKDVLKEAITYRGSSMRNYLDSFGEQGKFKERIKVYDRENQKCFLCQHPIQKIIQAGRSTFFCRHCQQ